MQRVGFWNCTGRSAEKLAVRGYANNVANENVEVVAEGNKVLLGEFARMLRQGPLASTVDEFKVEGPQFGGKCKAFDIEL